MKKISFFAILLLMIYSCRGPLSKRQFPAKEGNDQAISPNMSEVSHSADVRIIKEAIKVEPCSGCITIADLYSGKSKYSGKIVRITGKITKINPAIMGKNWIHIQDGTESSGFFDLTVTTDLDLQTGKIITIEGKVSTDRDFGYGYTYEILLENGTIVR